MIEKSSLPHNNLRVAAIQMEIVSGEPRKNIVRAEALLNEAAAQGAQAALLPELWTTGYTLDRIAGIAQEHGEEFGVAQGRGAKFFEAFLGTFADGRLAQAIGHGIFGCVGHGFGLDSF